MFERKNQSILAPHYSALVSHEGDDDDDDEVFTLARKNHDIETATGAGADDGSDLEETLPSTITPNGPLISAEDLSKRKLKAATSKKALLKFRPAPDKLIFDEETGEARNFYQQGSEIENLAGGLESRAKFLEQERERMKEAHKVDREVAREKKREKKRKRQERERERLEVGSGDEGSDGDDGGGGVVAVIGGGDYSDQEFGGQGSESEDEGPRGKKTKHSTSSSRVGAGDSIEDEEALALRLLQGS